jgi:hypothetical protein
MSEDRRGGDFPFDPGACSVSGHLMLRSGEQVRCHGSRGSLERGGDSLERLEPSSEAEIGSRGWRPLNEAETRSRGRSAPERGGGLPRGVPPSSEAEIRLREAGDGRLMGHGGCWAAADRGPFSYSGCGWFG